MNKQEIKGHFRSGDVPTEAEFAEWIERCVTWVDDVSELPDACVALAGSCYLVGGKSVARCECCDGEWKWVPKAVSGGGTASYLDLTNKPRINNVTLSGLKSLSDIGAMPDFNNLRDCELLSDTTRIVIAENGMAFKTTLGALKAYLSISPVRGGCRLPIGFGGRQDGENRRFETESRFVAGTSALYLNGQRLYPDKDYTEKAGAAFEMAKAPDENDRLLFEAVKAENLQ